MCIYNSWCMFIYVYCIYDTCHVYSVVLNIFDLDNSEIQKPLSSPPPPTKKNKVGFQMFFLQAPLQSPTGLGTRRWDPETDKGLMEG